MKRICLVTLLLLTVTSLKSQQHHYIKDISICVDTNTYSLRQDGIYVNREQHLPFCFSKNNSVALVEIETSVPHVKLWFKETSDYQVLDSLYEVLPGFMEGKIRLTNLTENDFQQLQLVLKKDSLSQQELVSIKLLPYTKTYLQIQNLTEELFIGEEKIFELSSNNLDNVKITADWSTGNAIDYRFSQLNGQLRLHLLPNQTGNQKIDIVVHTYKPYVDEKTKCTIAILV
ncbi:MAG: hypothetical protein HC896_12275 [Bacteroidales bacterium]|nr:hypothetical protein [Bacteroidales bacterium]